MSNSGAPHPSVLAFVIEEDKALELQVKDLVGTMDSVVEALFRDREKCKAAGLVWDEQWGQTLRAARAELDYRKNSEEFKQIVREILGS